MTSDKKIETDLAAGIEDALGLTEMASRLVPRSTTEDQDYIVKQGERAKQASEKYDRDMKHYEDMKNMPQTVGVQKRSMVPVEHFEESMLHLLKAQDDLKALHTKLLGEIPPKTQAGIPANGKTPVVAKLHQQAVDINRIATEMASMIAQIRDVL